MFQKKGNGGDVAGDEAIAAVAIGCSESPHTKIDDDEELQGAQECGEADTADGAAIAFQCLSWCVLHF
jgi:hypothetical protein